MRDLKSPKPPKAKGNRRKKEKQPRDWNSLLRRCLRLVIMAGGIVLVGSGTLLAGRMVLDAGYFHVASIRVENGERLSAEEILALSNIREGESIFRLDLDTIARKIEENPWVDAVHMKRILPDEVVIHVEERIPRAILSMGYLYYIDGDGDIFKILDKGDNLDFPVISGLERDFVLENPKVAKVSLKGAIDLIAEIEGRESFTLDDISEIRFDASEGYRIFTYAGGVPIRMGYDNFANKIDRLEKIFINIEPRLSAVRDIDLNVADRVIVRVDGDLDHEKG